MIISIHHYELASSATDADFRAAIREAERRGLFDLPGLTEYRFLRGIKGVRKDEYTAVWRYKSRDVWESLWGPVDDPVSADEYPEAWQIWEDELLGPLIVGDPDDIDFTSYEVIDAGTDR